MTRDDEKCAANATPLHMGLSEVRRGLESVATGLKSEITTEQPRRRGKALRGEADVTVEELARLASALEAMPDADQQSEEHPCQWLRYDDATWTPVYPDGTTGHRFTWTQMMAARGEHIGDVIESLTDAGLIHEVREVGIDVFDHGRG
ncbi:hypothetical protein ACQP0C_25445 [Nocardia sp. CA-129566]|uniref:hypothetical protein n=1 Tax=Nocardia sp. CA-129566 TaxID=3239976 RepID=UPI003D95C00D